MKKVATRYGDMITRFKKASPEKPECVSDATWEKWLAFWRHPEVKDKSEKASRNRKSEKVGLGTGSSRYCGGSRSAYAHALELEKERAPDAYDCMLHMHTMKDGTFIDEQGRIIAVTRYRDIITRFKKASPEKPECVSDATWEKWLAFWSRPAVMDKSEKADSRRDAPPRPDASTAYWAFLLCFCCGFKSVT
ncbi:hypothetical protein CASFOL_020124 [Castilleja foliolosa]|uniref:Uncharacterized protein n=1 Tax=Castilleja foliolosa TaxID=1961234 RepID=A0ABD3D0S5_9LAMI